AGLQLLLAGREAALRVAAGLATTAVAAGAAVRGGRRAGPGEQPGQRDQERRSLAHPHDVLSFGTSWVEPQKPMTGQPPDCPAPPAPEAVTGGGSKGCLGRGWRPQGGCGKRVVQTAFLAALRSLSASQRRRQRSRSRSMFSATSRVVPGSSDHSSCCW